MNQQKLRDLGRAWLGIMILSALLLAVALPAAAHEHSAARAHQGEGQVLANGQNHPRFLADADGNFQSCESYGPIPGSSIGPAWYGLETAHHGPDAGTPGKADGCYMIEGGLSPLNPDSFRNPAIK